MLTSIMLTSLIPVAGRIFICVIDSSHLLRRNDAIMNDITIIGSGLAGSEAAWQIAKRGLHVNLYEMRPKLFTPAHKTAGLAEIVCSNSLGSENKNGRISAAGILKEELILLDSLILSCANESRVPAGGALAVDREKFSALVTKRITSHPNITLIREEFTEIPDTPAIIASGPLTSDKLAESIRAIAGERITQSPDFAA